jgi:hypothetical protein
MQQQQSLSALEYCVLHRHNCTPAGCWLLLLLLLQFHCEKHFRQLVCFLLGLW